MFWESKKTKMSFSKRCIQFHRQDAALHNHAVRLASSRFDRLSLSSISAEHASRTTATTHSRSTERLSVLCKLYHGQGFAPALHIEVTIGAFCVNRQESTAG